MPQVLVIGRIIRRTPELLATGLSPRSNAAAFAQGVALLRRHWRLILEMAREDLVGKYRGQFLGSAWALIHPLAMTGVYLFIFGIVFAQRVAATREMPLDYTSYILSGLIPWLTFQLAMQTSVNAITNNAPLVKQFVFPVEVLPGRDVAASLLTWVVGVVSTLLYISLREGALPWTWVLLPLVLAAQILAMMGVAFLFSAVAVFFRDLKDFINLFCLVAVFLMPIVYLPGWVPDLFKPILWVNPFTYMVWVYQDTIYFGRIEHPLAWVLFMGSAPLLFAWGVRLFRTSKPMFSSVL